MTGGTRGIGLEIACQFLETGAEVFVTGTNQESDYDHPAFKEDRFNYFRADFTNNESLDRLAAFIVGLGKLDVLVNNAGITGFEEGPAPHDPENASLAEWHRVHGVNTDGCFLGCRYALRAMKAKGTGSIINMSSRSGLVGIPGAAAYAASKAAMRNHSKSVALYAAQQGWAIRCNSVHPAAILTDIWEPMLGDGPDRDAKMAALVADTPLKRFGTAEEVAAACVYLASADSGYMTGAELTLDGGLLAGSAASPGS